MKYTKLYNMYWNKRIILQNNIKCFQVIHDEKGNVLSLEIMVFLRIFKMYKLVYSEHMSLGNYPYNLTEVILT